MHGGGPRIKRELDKSNIQSKFIRGLRVTDKKIINIVESVLIDFNNDIVDSLKEVGSEAVSVHTEKIISLKLFQKKKSWDLWEYQIKLIMIFCLKLLKKKKFQLFLR